MRALIGDEWSVLRAGVAAVLAGTGIDEVVQAETLEGALAEARRAPLDLVVLGRFGDAGVELAVPAVLAVTPGARVIVLLDQPDRRAVLGAVDAGAEGVLTRAAREDEVVDAVLRVGRGERVVSPRVLDGAFGELAPVDLRAPVVPGGLTERERAVLAELVSGRSNREIADALFIGEATVKTHLRNIYDKLEVSNRVQAVGKAIERRLV
jgi:DNA-binding NarL/FixJ family response regulator